MKLFRALSLVALCVIAQSASVGCAAQSSKTVKLADGAIAGVHADAVSTYLGIPYAAAPLGKLRWQAPQAVRPWKHVKQARNYAPACAQTAVWVTHPKSEDCLYLNVWAPDNAAKLPVIVWIHGGGYFGGTAAQSAYDGSNLARRGAVVVTLNYRLGIFGFFSHPALSAESPARVSGNQGILDQMAALRWVKRNIAAFGGDPDRVTIMGESAGGASVAILVASPLAQGLFQRAISESGNYAVPLTAGESRRFERKDAEANGVAFATALGAQHLAQLRRLPVAALQKSAWAPRTLLDGHVLRENMTATYRQRRQQDVPVLVGWNAEEGKDLAPEILGTSAFTAANYRSLVGKLLDRVPPAAVFAAYPGATDVQAKASIHQLTNDWWGWRMLHWASLHAQNGQAKSYAYFFAHRPAEPLTPCGYGCGAGHGAEIPYLFDNLGVDARPWTSADRQLATRLADTVVRFAATGNPNGSGLPVWPTYDGANASVMRIGSAAELEAHPLPDFSVFAPLGE